MTRRHLRALWFVLAAAAACTSCAQPAPPGVDPVAYNRALHDCKEYARAYYGYGYGERPVFATVGTPGYFLLDKSWEIVDPCLKAKGFPPPPY